MAAFKNQKASFRHRGFQPAEAGTETIMVFGKRSCAPERGRHRHAKTMGS